ncbi:hypothetical protein K457DRAFT_25746 [Linnemannia elongata AG-77]|uniref:Uncharacterized protein n=1 Tax=Linnemannia elongata AG-77 TaxID=1314771 RepID=A0A197JE88_9FUNG|nr:hypothetical protein K457DRAFT_25746 [Linnemannia elongata AG-77]
MRLVFFFVTAIFLSLEVQSRPAPPSTVSETSSSLRLWDKNHPGTVRDVLHLFARALTAQTPAQALCVINFVRVLIVLSVAQVLTAQPRALVPYAQFPAMVLSVEVQKIFSSFFTSLYCIRPG